ncbi:hypothetical protein RND81_09G238700 [Saponaria officinalis]|uniref:Pentatricopeptide repeat-containing protein-mitochondrial domain-containing protein n=1 Tax=Saponaria officinalis TaxID=3572 RepID=A0AAW1IRP3_SAPOF
MMSAIIASIINRGILVQFQFQFHCRFGFRFHPQFVLRNYSSYSGTFPTRRCVDVVDDPQLFIQSVRQQCKLGFSGVDIPVSIFHQLNCFRPRPSIVVFNQLFTAMCKIRPHPPLSTVITFCYQLELSGLRPDRHSVGILANCYSRLGRYIKLGYPPDAVIITTLLNGLIASDKLRMAIQLLDKMVKLGIQPTLVTYGAMFKGLCRIGDNAAALRLLRNMESKAPFKPDVVIYNTLIDSLGKDQLLPQALGLFKEMKTKGILPNVITYSTLIRGLCNLGRWDEAKDLLSEMLNNSIAPDIETYNTLIDMYCKEGNVDEARAILELMTERGVHPNVITYSALLDGYCLRGEMAKAENLVDIMVKDGIVPNIVTFSTLINGYCKSKQVDKAVENRLQFALQKFEEMKDRGVAPNVFTYSSLLHGLLKMLKNAQVDRAISLHREMENNGVASNIRMYSVIINGLCEAGRLAEAAEVFSYLVAKGRLGDATELLKEMADNGCSPHECTYNTIIKAFLNANDVAKALHYLHIMRGQGFAADAATASLFLGLLTDPNVNDADKALLQKYFLERHGM